MRRASTGAAAAALALCLATAGAQGPGGGMRFQPLSPIPDRGAVPPIAGMMAPPPDEVLARRAELREVGREVRRIRHRYLGGMRDPGKRREGIEALRRFTEPDELVVLIEELRSEQDDVRLALLDHLASAGGHGQMALARMAIHDPGEAIRHEASARVSSPPGPGVLAVIDDGLRSPRHAVANAAGSLAGSVNALQAIPLLIFAQVTGDRPAEQGDLAWIAFQTQRAYVQRIDAVVGDNSAAFIPIPGIVTDGSILRVVDAVVVIYRTEVHRVLVAMTTREWGRPTDEMGYDIPRWWNWYNQEYVPFQNERMRLAALAAEPPAVPEPPPAGPGPGGGP